MYLSHLRGQNDMSRWPRQGQRETERERGREREKLLNPKQGSKANRKAERERERERGRIQEAKERKKNVIFWGLRRYLLYSALLSLPGRCQQAQSLKLT